MHNRTEMKVRAVVKQFAVIPEVGCALLQVFTTRLRYNLRSARIEQRVLHGDAANEGPRVVCRAYLHYLHYDVTNESSRKMFINIFRR